MNKYRDKSDFEINKAVAGCYLTREYRFNSADKIVELMDINLSCEFGGEINLKDKYVTGTFDPCNNPADSMPIIKDNLISLEHDGIAWMVSCVRHPEISVWDGCENYNDNFYRKAMELFLLMKDAENES